MRIPRFGVGILPIQIWAKISSEDQSQAGAISEYSQTRLHRRFLCHHDGRIGQARYDDQSLHGACFVGLQERCVVLERYATVRISLWSHQVAVRKQSGAAKQITLTHRLHSQCFNAVKRLLSLAQFIYLRWRRTSIMDVDLRWIVHQFAKSRVSLEPRSVGHVNGARGNVVKRRPRFRQRWRCTVLSVTRDSTLG